MKRTFTDQLNNRIEITFPPERIISLVPSQTELLFDLGLSTEIAGITKFCIHPAEFCRNKPRIGGTKNFDFDKISAINPDLILANKEENYKEGIEALQKKYPVWISDINNIKDCCEMITNIGQMVGKEEKSKLIADKISSDLSLLKPEKIHRVAYLIWKDPYMTVGNDTFIDHMLSLAGFANIFGHLSRYPVLTPETITAAKPELIFLSSEPYPFREKHIEEFSAICPEARIMLVDGEMFSWHGSRMIYAADYFKQLREQLR